MNARAFFRLPALASRADYVLNYSELASREDSELQRNARCARPADSVRLVAVSKTFAGEAVRRSGERRSARFRREL